MWERDGQVRRLSVPDDGLSIGRKPATAGASYCTQAESVSRHHCVIRQRSGVWLLEDLGSSNGSRINGQLIDGPTPVRSGDVLLIGGNESGITAQLVVAEADVPESHGGEQRVPGELDDSNTRLARWDPVDKIRASYDIVAEKYATELADDMVRRPFERGVFLAFAELVKETGSGLTGDLGCGPGHVSKALSAHGLEMFGVDISAAMIAQARMKFPAGRFRIGSFLDLPVPTDSWIGAVSLYATLHLDPAMRARAHSEAARVVRAGGHYLHGFYVSAPDQPPGSTYHLTKWFGHAVDLDSYFVGVEDGAAEMEAAGFEIVAVMVREPIWPKELPARRCYMMGRRR